MVSMKNVKGVDVRSEIRLIFKRDIEELEKKKKDLKEKIKSVKKYSKEYTALKTKLDSLNKRIIKVKRLSVPYMKDIEKESIYAKR